MIPQFLDSESEILITPLEPAPRRSAALVPVGDRSGALSGLICEHESLLHDDPTHVRAHVVEGYYHAPLMSFETALAGVQVRTRDYVPDS